MNGHRYRISNYEHSAITVALGENRTLQSGFQHVRSTNASTRDWDATKIQTFLLGEHHPHL
jgi:hypothetical protein